MDNPCLSKKQGENNEIRIYVRTFGADDRRGQCNHARQDQAARSTRCERQPTDRCQFRPKDRGASGKTGKGHSKRRFKTTGAKARRKGGDCQSGSARRRTGSRNSNSCGQSRGCACCVQRQRHLL